MLRYNFPPPTPDLQADFDKQRLARTPGTEYTPGLNLKFGRIAKNILNDRRTVRYRNNQRINSMYPSSQTNPSQTNQTKSQIHNSVGRALTAFNIIQPPELQPAVIFVKWLRNKTASQLTCIKPKILDVIKPCVLGYDCIARCDNCENCKESIGINIRSTIESSAITTQLNQIVEGKFKDRTDLCCWLCGEVIPFGNCEIEHVYSSTVTAITSMQYFLAYSNNEQVSNDRIIDTICNKRTDIHTDKNYDIRYNSLYPAHRLCNRCKAGDVFTDFNYDIETKNFKLKPNIVEISAFAERYAKYIYEGRQQPFTAQGGESAPVYLNSDMLRGNDLALIAHFQSSFSRGAFKQNIIDNITRIMDYSSEFNISEQTLIQNVTSMQHYYPKYYKSKNKKYRQQGYCKYHNLC